LPVKISPLRASPFVGAASYKDLAPAEPFFNSRLSFLVLYSATRDAKASNRLFDLSVLLLRLVGLRSVAV
jgi:hypothetical protein